MSNALPSWQYRDPQEVLERKQEYHLKKSCKGCKFEDEIMLAGKVEKYCLHGKRYGNKCSLYVAR